MAVQAQSISYDITGISNDVVAIDQSVRNIAHLTKELDKILTNLNYKK